MSRRYRGRKENKPRITAMAEVTEAEEEKPKVNSANYDPKTGAPNKTPIAQSVGAGASSAARTPANAPRTKQAIATSTSTVANLQKQVSVLYDILSMKRPAWSQVEERMIKKFIDPLGAEKDNFGNRIITIPLKDGKKSRTLFSCHTDTVHHQQGIQQIFLDPERAEIFVEGPNTNCLGADDGTGIYIMLTMIKHKVPGTYIFHRAEEVGGKGSAYIRDNRGSWLRQFDRAIAFDRKGQGDVIIAQSCGIIASETFGNALAKELNDGTGLKFANCKFGSFTDTANYYKYIGECINLSVGYERQHGINEVQNIDFLKEFIPRVIRIDWEALPSERIPGEAAPKYPQAQTQNWGSRGFGDNNYQQNTPPTASLGKPAGPTSLMELVSDKKLAMLVMQKPRIALSLLKMSNITLDDLWDAEWEVSQEEADQLVDRFNQQYGAC